MKLWIKVGIAGTLVSFTGVYITQNPWLKDMFHYDDELYMWLFPTITVWAISAMFLRKR